jgi:capsular polysaccharide export protein
VPTLPDPLADGGWPHASTFLDIPPFPGRKVDRFVRLPGHGAKDVSLAECVALARKLRVGGTYWGRQPELPVNFHVVRGSHPVEMAPEHGAPVQWPGDDCDPWHMLGRARALVCVPDDVVLPIALMLDIPTYLVEPHGPPRRWTGDAMSLLSALLLVQARFASPFGGSDLNLLELIELSGFWRKLIDSNRSIHGGVGFAFWKQETVLPLLWGGTDRPGFFTRPAIDAPDGALAVWRSRAPSGVVERLELSGTPLVEVEDGFLRSKGLGADCIPPLSITVDRLGAYFDPGQPSELENLLQSGAFDAALVERAKRLRHTIVAAGLGKYESGEEPLERGDASKRHILVAGQVEDDRSILTGGFGLSNLDLLRRVRRDNADAYIIYKPHPDVLAGHRKGHIDEHIGRQCADKVVTDKSISSLIAMVDEVHVNTSLAGFEALMRHKDVTTYGVPFYAGWGLTRDLGPVPARRTARRSLDELVAATLLLYPLYLDPVSGLPAPAEVVVDRLAAPAPRAAGILVTLRRLQGRLNRWLKLWPSK